MHTGLITSIVNMAHTGVHSATACAIFEKMDDVLTRNGISWWNCIGVSVDNTSVNLGKRNSIMTRVQQKNAATYFMGCPCHVLHITSMKAAEVFVKVKTRV